MDMLNKDDTDVYEISDSREYKDYRCFIRSKIEYKEMNKLIFHIQNKYQSIIKQYLLTTDEIEDILVKCYAVDESDDTEVDEVIDLQENFKRYFNNESGSNIIDNSLKYEVNGLVGELKKIADLTIEICR